jgi:methionyl-tRNA formyltransferase
MHKEKMEMIDNAARKIQSLYHRLKFKKELKDMRQKLKALPYPVRRSYVKMQELKLSTMQLMSDTSNKFHKTTR